MHKIQKTNTEQTNPAPAAADSGNNNGREH